MVAEIGCTETFLMNSEVGHFMVHVINFEREIGFLHNVAFHNCLDLKQPLILTINKAMHYNGFTTQNNNHATKNNFKY